MIIGPDPMTITFFMEGFKGILFLTPDYTNSSCPCQSRGIMLHCRIMMHRKKSAIQNDSDSLQKKYGIIFAELMEKVPSEITRRIVRRRRKEIGQAGLRIDSR
jgi:hypothetical protein